MLGREVRGTGRRREGEWEGKEQVQEGYKVKKGSQRKGKQQ